MNTDQLYCPVVLGSPCMKAEVWAAWAQALLSGLAIFYSGRFAVRQARSARAEKLETYLAILGLAAGEAASAVNHVREIPKGFGIATSTIDGQGPIFAKLAADLDAISFHDVPHHRLIGLVRDAATACRTLDIHYERNFGIPGGVSEYMKGQIYEASEMLDNIYDEAKEVRASI